MIFRISKWGRDTSVVSMFQASKLNFFIYFCNKIFRTTACSTLKMPNSNILLFVTYFWHSFSCDRSVKVIHFSSKIKIKNLFGWVFWDIFKFPSNCFSRWFIHTGLRKQWNLRLFVLSTRSTVISDRLQSLSFYWTVASYFFIHRCYNKKKFWTPN